MIQVFTNLKKWYFLKFFYFKIMKIIMRKKICVKYVLFIVFFQQFGISVDLHLYREIMNIQCCIWIFWIYDKFKL